MKRKYVVVDLETTGNSPKTGERIIQFAAVVIENNVITHTFSTFVNPEKEIPTFITNLTKIKNSDVSDAPLFSTLIPQLYDLFKDSVFVAHNIHFDYVFLESEFQQHGYEFPAIPTIDTVELSRIVLPTMDSYKLTDLAESLHIHHDRPHQADSDAFVTAELLLHLIEKLKKLPIKTLQLLLQLSKHYKSELNVLISSIISSNIVLSCEDDEEYIHILNAVVKRASFYLPTEDKVGEYKNVYEKVQVYAAFQSRKSQLEMMDIVDKTFQEDKFAVIEAGTGTGKTLGYIIPAISYASKQEEQIVISTYSLQLQNQIMTETIPLIEGALNKKLSASVLKGRKHYLSLKKFAASLEQEDSNYDIVLTKSKIIVWLTMTLTGDIDELNLPSGGTTFWEEVCCSYKDRDGVDVGIDYYERAIHRAMMSDIIITNHALLLYDIGREERIFEGIHTVVIDEAHRFVETATGILGKSYSAMYCNHLLTKIGSVIEKIKSEKKVLEGISHIDQEIKELKLELDDLFRVLYKLGKKNTKQQVEISSKQNIPYSKIASGRELLLIEDVVQRIVHKYKDVHAYGETLVGMEVDSFSEARLYSLLTTLAEKMSILEQFFQITQNSVNWIELEQKGTFHSLILYIQPVSVAQSLSNEFFSKLKRGIFTSATLSVKGDFQFFLQESGLNDYEVKTSVLPSPFDYKKKVKLFVPMELPSYKKVPFDVYTSLIIETIEEIIANVNGRSLVLFQSNELLHAVHNGIKESERLEDTVIFAQGNSRNRSRITKYFKQFEKAALFGGLTFWEGIDFDGSSLQCVIIVRLPFSSPEHPYVKLKSEMLQKEGRSAFNEFSLPQAILRFKQGFGRLIRSEKNKGVIFILDQRIMDTHYGNLFLNSIPSVNVSHQPLGVCMKEMTDFLKENNGEE